VATSPAVSQIGFVDPELARDTTELRPIFIGTTHDELNVLALRPLNSPMTCCLRIQPTRSRRRARKPQYAISVRQAGPEWTLSVRLRKSAPPTLGDGARTASELKHAVAILPRYTRLVAKSR